MSSEQTINNPKQHAAYVRSMVKITDLPSALPPGGTVAVLPGVPLALRRPPVNIVPYGWYLAPPAAAAKMRGSMILRVPSTTVESTEIWDDSLSVPAESIRDENQQHW
jgi:hypothetical protein